MALLNGKYSERMASRLINRENEISISTNYHFFNPYEINPFTHAICRIIR